MRDSLCKSSLILMSIVIGLSLPVHAAQQSESDRATVNVKVINADSAAISGATVTIVAQQGNDTMRVPEDQGAYVASVAAGSYVVNVSAEGYFRAFRFVEVASNQTKDVMIMLEKKSTKPAQGTQGIIVQDSEGNTINDATVEVAARGSEAWRTVPLIEGVHTVTLDSGTYVFKVSAVGYKTVWQEILVFKNQKETTTIRLSKDGSVVVRPQGTQGIIAQDSEGNTITGATVEVAARGTEEWQTVPLIEGVHTITLDSGTYVFRVSATGYTTVSQEILVYKNQKETTTIRLAKAETVSVVRGRISLHGQAVGDARVYLRNGGKRVDSTLTDPEGGYAFEVTVASGRLGKSAASEYEIEALITGMEPIVVAVAPAVDMVSVTDIEAAPTSVLAGKALAASGSFRLALQKKGLIVSTSGQAGMLQLFSLDGRTVSSLQLKAGQLTHNIPVTGVRGCLIARYTTGSQVYSGKVIVK